MDKIVFDVETKNSFKDVGGRHNLHKLEVSVVGFYSYNRDEYFAVDDTELDKLEEIFLKAGLVIGFATRRFDFPVLQKYVSYDISKVKNVDILEEVEAGLGRRVGLDVLAQHNLGIGKSSHGLEAIKMYREGRLDELRDYCIQDVRVTKKLYDFALDKGYIDVPDKWSGEAERVMFEYREEFLPQASLF